jgi:hypothetical protein
MTSKRPRRSRPRPDAHERTRDRGRRIAPYFDTAQWDEANMRLAARSRLRCEIGGEPLSNEHVERHHRERRRDGGDRLANLLLVCSTHHQLAHSEPRWAREHGYIVSALADVDSAAVPVLLWGTDWVLLTDTGKAVRTNTPAEKV